MTATADSERLAAQADRYARPSCRRPSSSSASARPFTPRAARCRRSPGSTSTYRPARSSPCSGRAAAARRRCCAWSADSTSRHPGTVTVDGATPHDARAAKRVGFVPQSPGLLPWRTVAANARLLLDVNRRVAVRQAPDPLDLLADVGLADFAGAYPHELSGGMQQRVSLVRAMALGAPLLADGRAVRRPRRDHPRRHAPPPRPAVRATGDDGPVRHPLDRRGRVHLRSGRRALGPAGPHRRRRVDRPPPPPPPRARGRPGVLRPRDPAAGVAPRRQSVDEHATHRARRAHRDRRVRRAVGAVRVGLRRAPVRAAAAVTDRRGARRAAVVLPRGRRRHRPPGRRRHRHLAGRRRSCSARCWRPRGSWSRPPSRS